MAALSRAERGTAVMHGRPAAERHDPIYRAWQTMNDACGNPGSPLFRKFGALGICAHSAWREDFTAFVANMGEQPAATMLDRHYRSRFSTGQLSVGGGPLPVPASQNS